MITDRMRINHADTDAIPDYGSLFLRIYDKQTHVNDYCGSDDSDVDKLDLITNAAVGSTCLFISGDIYIKTFDGWAKFAENGAGTTQAAALTSFAPLTMGKSAAVLDTPLPEIEPETYTEDGIPTDEVRGDDK